MAWLLLPLLVGGCVSAAPPAGHPARGSEEALASAASGVSVYRCGGDERFTVRSYDDSVRVQRDLYAVTLPRVLSASGARYSDGSATFWSRGDEARLETPTDTLASCRGRGAATPWDVSRLLGYELRAIGQEPGWMVEVERGRRMHVLADYGAVEFFTASPHEERDPTAVLYRAADPAGGEVVLTVREAACEDVMSGEAFPLTVSVRLRGAEYAGCGRRL